MRMCHKERGLICHDIPGIFTKALFQHFRVATRKWLTSHGRFGPNYITHCGCIGFGAVHSSHVMTKQVRRQMSNKQAFNFALLVAQKPRKNEASIISTDASKHLFFQCMRCLKIVTIIGFCSLAETLQIGNQNGNWFVFRE